VLSFDIDTVEAIKVDRFLGSLFSLSILEIIIDCSKSIGGTKSTEMTIQHERSNTSNPTGSV